MTDEAKALVEQAAEAIRRRAVETCDADESEQWFATQFSQAALVGTGVLERLETQAREIERLNEALCFIGKWVERGMFCNSVTASEAISCIAYYPGMPWNSQRWDVDHKPYAAAYYAKFPRTAALAGGSHE